MEVECEIATVTQFMLSVRMIKQRQEQNHNGDLVIVLAVKCWTLNVIDANDQYPICFGPICNIPRYWMTCAFEEL